MPKPNLAVSRLPRLRGSRRSSPEDNDVQPRRPARPALQAIREDKDEVIEAMLREAKKGSYLHAKFCFDFAGITAADPAAVAEQQKSLAQYLIDQLDLEPENEPADA